MSQRCLGRLPPRPDQMRKALRFARYVIASQLPPPPPSNQWSTKPGPNWGMMVNDQLGDCTCAAMGHQLQAWTGNVGTEFTAPDPAIVQAYSAISGYNPQTGANDNGAVIQDALNYWRTQGVAGHTIAAFVMVDPKQHDDIKTASRMFGGVYLGVDLPRGSQNQQVWSVPNHVRLWRQREWAPGSWGGHAIYCPDYDADGLTCITWGAPMKMTWAWFDAYCTEAYAALSPDWFDGTKVAPSGFDFATLSTDLALLTGH